MNLTDLHAHREALRCHLQKLEAIVPSCASCTHSVGHLCEKYNACPPPEVQRTGCTEWQFDDIPF